MDGVRRILFVLVVVLIGQTATADEPQRGRPSQTPNLSPQIINRDDHSRPTDGTFGYDSRRPLFFSQSAYGHLFHGSADRRAGGYRTDGLRVFDIFSVRPIKKALHAEKGPKEEE